jgi:molecular chaperone HscB
MISSVPDFTADHFALFGLARAQALELNVLESRFRDIQTQIHPDRHAHGSDADQRLAMQWSTQVNAAYQTLKSPGTRARYLLQLLGHDPQIENNTAMPTEFLVSQMEMRESVVEARHAGNETRLDEVRARLLAEIKSEHLALNRLIDVEKNYAAAATLVRQLMFQEKLLIEIDDALEAVTA